MHLHFKHLVEDSYPDLDSDAGKETDQNSSRQKISKEAQLEQSGYEQKPSRQQRH